ncbi:glycosyltransferase family 25 protein [Hoeflea marina]|nr:glycosyltransferase family 25 protein [Hoeflea marina]
MHLINLQRHHERRARMQRIGAELGIDWRIFPAVDALDPQADLARWDPEGILNPSEVACFLSHRRLWQDIADGEDAMAAIFEDDLHIAPALRDLLSCLPVRERPTIYRLECDPLVVRIRPEPEMTVGGRGLHHYQGWVLGSAAYVLNRPAARLLLARADLVRLPVDLFLHNSLAAEEDTDIDRLVAIPSPCIQDKMLVWLQEAARPATGLRKALREIRRPFLQFYSMLGRQFGARPQRPESTPAPPPTADYLVTSIVPTHFRDRLPLTRMQKIVREVAKPYQRLRESRTIRRAGMVRTKIKFG